MKINSIQRDISLKQGSSGLRSLQKRDKHEYVAGMCDNNTRGNNTGYCGSFTGKSEAAAGFLDKILSSSWFGKFTAYAEAHNIASSALIALILAGVMRPATIMALPGDKDKDDKIYASGHAMASGIMGFAVSTIITSPFDESIKKIFDDRKFIGKKLGALNTQIDNLLNKENATKEDKILAKTLKSKRGAMKTLAKNIPDWIIAVPRSVLTIALIPPILKYVFGVEKKKPQTQEQTQPIQKQLEKQNDFIEKPVFASFKGKTNQSNPQTPTFTGNAGEIAEDIVAKLGSKESNFFEPFNKMYDKMTDKIAEKFTSWYVDSPFIEALADRFKNSKNLYQHCLTVGSVITSGLYMERTYTNKKLDKDRRNTLVVNQGLTLGVSTAGAYMLDKYLSGWWDNVTARFAGHLLGDKDFYPNYLAKKNEIKEANAALIAKDGKNAELKSMPNIMDIIKEQKNYKDLIPSDSKLLRRKIKGIGLLKSMIVFGFVYRFFVPVVVTKPANKLCDMYLEHKKAQKEERNV